MGEAIVLDNISDLHQALYDYMVTINTVPGCEFIGFDSSRTQTTLPAIGMKISLDNIAVDRTRPTPSLAARLEIKTGPQQDFTYGGVVYPNVYTQRLIRYPLPITLTYKVWTWSKSSLTALALDQAVLRKFPERGVLKFTIGGEEGEFPIRLQGIQNLDDLKENFRERLYMFEIEAYTVGWMPDETEKIITTQIEEFYSGGAPEDATPDNFIDRLIEQPD